MRIATVLALVLVIGCGGGKLTSANTPECLSPCYDGPAEAAGKGICKYGQWVCPLDGGMVCVGAIYPQEPACNGFDNDCDGKLDTPQRSCYDGPNGTQNVGTCRGGLQTCSQGGWGSCSGEIIPKPETCNALDDDCNGVVDDGLSISLCYDGPAGTIGVGICSPGYSTCINGVPGCYGEVLPKAEACNGIDDDCNGLVDDGLRVAPQDIVLVVDYSGSMEGQNSQLPQSETKEIEQAWLDLEVQYSDPMFSFSVVDAPGPYIDAVVAQAGTDLSSTLLAGAVSQDLPFGYAGSGNEPTLDALAYVCSSENFLNLVWHSGADRSIIVFSDAVPRSFEVADGGSPNSVSAVQDLCTAAGVRVNVFTLPVGYSDLSNGQPYGQWSSVVSPQLGSVYNIYEGATKMERDITSILSPWGCSQ